MIFQAKSTSIYQKNQKGHQKIRHCCRVNKKNPGIAAGAFI
jgi:hypothetical protein